MPTFICYAQTNRVGSKDEWEFDVDAADLEGLSQEERDELLRDYAKDALENIIEWGWYEADEA